MVVPNAWPAASGQVFDQCRSISRTGLADITVRLSVNLFGAPALSLPGFAKYQPDTIVGVRLMVAGPIGHLLIHMLRATRTSRQSAFPSSPIIDYS